MEKRIVIGGCRNYHDYSRFCRFVDGCLSSIKLSHSIVILSGHCSGVDAMAERYAKEKGHALELFPADWTKGRKTGPFETNK